MREILQNDITEYYPDYVSNIKCMYTELPSFDVNLYRCVNLLANDRKKNDKESYIIADDSAAFWDYDKKSKIKVYIASNNAYVNMYLYQWGMKLNISDNRQLQRALSALYDTVVDPCAGTGESTSMFQNAVLMDINPLAVGCLKNKYEK